MSPTDVDTCIGCGEEKKVTFIPNVGLLCIICEARTRPKETIIKKRKTKKEIRKEYTQEIYVVGEVDKIQKNAKPFLDLLETYKARVLKRQERIAFFETLINKSNLAIDKNRKEMARLEKKVVLARILEKPCLSGRQVQILGITNESVVRVKIGTKWYALGMSDSPDGTSKLIEIVRVKERRATKPMVEKIQI